MRPRPLGAHLVGPVKTCKFGATPSEPQPRKICTGRYKKVKVLYCKEKCPKSLGLYGKNTPKRCVFCIGLWLWASGNHYFSNKNHRMTPQNSSRLSFVSESTTWCMLWCQKKNGPGYESKKKNLCLVIHVVRNLHVYRLPSCLFSTVFLQNRRAIHILKKQQQVLNTKGCQWWRFEPGNPRWKLPKFIMGVQQGWKSSQKMSMAHIFFLRRRSTWGTIMSIWPIGLINHVSSLKRFNEYHFFAMCLRRFCGKVRPFESWTILIVV